MADTSDLKSDGIGPSKPSHLGSSPSAPIISDYELDSPNFIPKELEKFMAREYKRINRWK